MAVAEWSKEIRAVVAPAGSELRALAAARFGLRALVAAGSSLLAVGATGFWLRAPGLGGTQACGDSTAALAVMDEQ